ncbi:hypothetical protein [Vibrio toranzoniae]|uniref:hypothetical protein n=1 Tax=Vibrio toranzoniae TaxID=1194427 RepID=UPI0013774AC6|nr:hypothetical protein [Vibrio toranzoniae]NAZ94204.1 hypothetical protein [Vibrio toranzoniae]
MDELTKYGIKKNLVLWMAYLRLGQITLEQATERVEAYYLGIQETLSIDELKVILPIFFDVRAMLNQFGGINVPLELFPKTESRDDRDALNEAMEKVEVELDKFIQLQARMF